MLCGKIILRFLCALRITIPKGLIMEYVLIVILLISALFIIGAVLMQNSDKEGLSGTIAGNQETYYGRDKSTRIEKILIKWTGVAAIVFGVAVFLAYVIQPDYNDTFSLDYWKDLSKYMSNMK